MSFSNVLAKKTSGLLEVFQQSSAYTQFFYTRTDTAFVKATVGSLLTEVGAYGPFITSASLTGIGRLSHILQDVRPLMQVVEDELPHPLLAQHDSCNLFAEAKHSKPTLSPAAYAVAAVARMIAEVEHPTAFLGYIYLLESTTAELGPRVKTLLDTAGLNSPFINAHAVEDVIHTARLAGIIDSIVAEIPEAAAAIERGFDNFSATYPLGIWESCNRRAAKCVE